MAGHPDDDYNRDILDIIPERFDADSEVYPTRSGSRLRNWLILGGAVLAVGVAVAVGLRFVVGGGANPNGIPVISADQRPIKIRPDDRGGMQVPNQDKLVYGRLEQGEGDAKVERLLPRPEQPMPPSASAVEPAPKTVTSTPEVLRPAAPVQPVAPQAAPIQPVPQASTVVPVRPVEPVAAAPAPVKPSVPAAAAVQPVIPVKPVTPPVVAAAPAVKPAVPAPAAPAVAVKPALTGGDYLVQLGALRSAPDADKEWGRIQRSNADVLGSLKSDVVQVDLGAKGVFWRLRAGPLSEQSARHVCGELKNRNQGCMVVRK